MSCLSIGIDWTRPRDILASHSHALLPINKRQSISWDEMPARLSLGCIVSYLRPTVE